MITECADAGGNSWNRYELLESVTETKTTRYNLALMLCKVATMSNPKAYLGAKTETTLTTRSTGA